jgi:hypothetical protein
MIAHLIDCTYCQFREVIPGNKKKKIYERELCGLTRQPIVPPDRPGRYCDKFHQIGHDCPTCIKDDQSVIPLDNP